MLQSGPRGHERLTPCPPDPAGKTTSTRGVRQTRHSSCLLPNRAHARARAHNLSLYTRSASPPERGEFASVAALTRHSLAPCPALQRCPDRDDKTPQAPTRSPLCSDARYPPRPPARHAGHHTYIVQEPSARRTHWTRAGAPP